MFAMLGARRIKGPCPRPPGGRQAARSISFLVSEHSVELCFRNVRHRGQLAALPKQEGSEPMSLEQGNYFAWLDATLISDPIRSYLDAVAERLVGSDKAFHPYEHFILEAFH